MFNVGDKIRFVHPGFYTDETGCFARDNIGNTTGVVHRVLPKYAPFPISVYVDEWVSEHMEDPSYPCSVDELEIVCDS